jgi:predicted metal-dependent hydrolase
MLSGFLSRFAARRPPPPVAESLQLGTRTVPLLVLRNPRARRYLLRLQPDGCARLTIPRGGSQSEARSFLDRNRAWLAQQVERHHSQPRLPAAWHLGTEIFLRGELIRIEAGETGRVRLGAENLFVADAAADLRPAIERHLRGLAVRELPVRVRELAAPHQLPVQRVTVRNQRSRWGSCSRHGTISLNWRLVQVPALVRDYIIFHELAHLRHLNHSDRFWAEVGRLCPQYPLAEKWLKANRQFLR